MIRQPDPDHSIRKGDIRNALPSVTVVMPVRNEATFIAQSLGRVLAQDYPQDRMEVVVADGMSSDATWTIAQAMRALHPNLRLIENHGRIVSTGLNAAIAEAHGDIIVRVDGHCEISPDYVRRCVEHLRNDDVGGVGGFMETVGDTPISQTIAAGMSSRFGVGDTAFRTVRGKTILADTVPFPAYWRTVIEQAGPFDEELVRNQDDEYNYRLRKMGVRILLADDIHSRYHSRSTLRALWRQYFQYGYWKVRVMQKHLRQTRLRQFVPPVFVTSLLMSTLLALFFPFGKVMLALVAGSYASANLAASLATARKSGSRRVRLLPLVFATLHFSYGLGVLVGLVRFWNRWGDSRTRPRALHNTSTAATP